MAPGQLAQTGRTRNQGQNQDQPVFTSWPRLLSICCPDFARDFFIPYRLTACWSLRMYFSWNGPSPQFHLIGREATATVLALANRLYNSINEEKQSYCVYGTRCCTYLHRTLQTTPRTSLLCSSNDNAKLLGKLYHCLLLKREKLCALLGQACRFT